MSARGGDVSYLREGADGLARARAFVERVAAEERDPFAREFVRASSGEAAYDPEGDVLLTAERGGKLVGVLLIMRDAADRETARFQWLLVDGPERNAGVGRELLSRGLEACRDRGLKTVRARSFAASPAGLHVYWLHGFRVVDLAGVRIGDATKESILFEKRLDAAAPGS